MSPTLLFAGSAMVWWMAGWPHGQAPSETARRAVRGLALLLAVIPVLMLFEAVSGHSLGIDITHPGILPTALSPYPGRISPNACCALLLLFSSLALLTCKPSRAVQHLAAACIATAVLIASLGILGYLLRLEQLYRWGSFNRLTLTTAIGLVLLAVALWELHLRWSGAQQRMDQHEQRITRRSLAVLAVIAIAAGAGGFAALEPELEHARQEEVQSTAVITGEALTSALDTGVWLAATTATRANVVAQVASAAARTDADDLDRLRTITQSLLTAGVTAARFVDPAGATLAEAGAFATSPNAHGLTLARDYAANSRLAWAGGFLLVTDLPITDKGEVIGRFQSEQHLALMDRLVARIRDAESSSDVLICARVADAASCLPSKLYPQTVTIPMFDANGRVNLPINRALLGESGVTQTSDLRGIRVVAAFGPLARTGLAMVVKEDTEAVFSAIRQRLSWLALLLGILVLAGTWLLRQHVRPLLKQLAASEQRMRDVMNAIPAIVGAFDAEERCIFANDLALKVHGIGRHQAVGMSMRDGLGEKSYALHQPHVRAAMQGKHQSFEGSLPWRGGTGYFQIHLVPMRDPLTDAVNGVYLMTFDITELRSAQLQQERSERRLRSITDNLPALISHLDAEGRYLFANRQFETLLGVKPEQLLGHRIDEVRDRAYVEQIKPWLRQAMAGQTVVFESETGPRNGEPRKYQQTYVPEFDTDGRVIGVFAVTFDITERKLAEQRVNDAQAKLKAIADNLPVLISYIDRQHRLTFANKTFQTWMGVDPELAVGNHLQALLGPALYEQRRQQIEQALSGERVEFEIVSQALGITRELQTVYIPDRRADDRIVGIYALSTDVTAMKDAERRLQELARNDPLTGLPNRREFESRLALALARSRRHGKGIGLIFMDVDHFKHINDTYGHAAGDLVLKEFAVRVCAAVRKTDTAARLAGDEFVVILEGLAGDAEASHVAAKLVEAIRAPMRLPGGAEISVTTSVGLACWGGTGEGAEDILDRADRALYRAKAAGRDTLAQTIF
ncbi:PAS domain-containing protein [Roseateles sp.]|uniref:sensor domain-containing protein n=1 Tax=Roseateles sp. TaxID=1971397 RepID=UPI0032650C3D